MHYSVLSKIYSLLSTHLHSQFTKNFYNVTCSRILSENSGISFVKVNSYDRVR